MIHLLYAFLDGSTMYHGFMISNAYLFLQTITYEVINMIYLEKSITGDYLPAQRPVQTHIKTTTVEHARKVAYVTTCYFFTNEPNSDVVCVTVLTY